MTFNHPSFDNHEQIIFCADPSVGLQAIIAIHNTALGPAAGGCRMQPYESVALALADVLRLSKGMSYKNSIAGLPLGGGKCVIIADPSAANKAELLRAFSKHVQRLAGQFWTAIDVGVGPADADILAENCDFIFSNASRYEPGFSAASYTALGGFVSIKAAAQHVWGTDDLTDRTVAVQGLGAAGGGLARHLHQAGARLVVADVNDQAVKSIVDDCGATAVDPLAIHAQDVDVFAPCALGGIINDSTLPHIVAPVICGLANNQLADDRHGQILADAGITYVPDYVANGGGITAAGAVIYSSPSDEELHQRVVGLHDTVLSILAVAAKDGRPTAHVADEIALNRIDAAGD